MFPALDVFGELNASKTLPRWSSKSTAADARQDGHVGFQNNLALGRDRDDGSGIRTVGSGVVVDLRVELDVPWSSTADSSHGATMDECGVGGGVAAADWRIGCSSRDVSSSRRAGFSRHGESAHWLQQTRGRTGVLTLGERALDPVERRPVERRLVDERRPSSADPVERRPGE